MIGRGNLLRNNMFKDVRKKAALDRADPLTPPVIKKICRIRHLLEGGEGEILQLIEIFSLNLLRQRLVIYISRSMNSAFKELKGGNGIIWVSPNYRAKNEGL